MYVVLYKWNVEGISGKISCHSAKRTPTVLKKATPHTHKNQIQQRLKQMQSYIYKNKNANTNSLVRIFEMFVGELGLKLL